MNSSVWSKRVKHLGSGISFSCGMHCLCKLLLHKKISKNWVSKYPCNLVRLFLWSQSQNTEFFKPANKLNLKPGWKSVLKTQSGVWMELSLSIQRSDKTWGSNLSRVFQAKGCGSPPRRERPRACGKRGPAVQDDDCHLNAGGPEPLNLPLSLICLLLIKDGKDNSAPRS